MFSAPSTNLRIELHSRPDRALIRLSGEALSHVAWELEQELNRVLAARPKLAVVDVEHLKLISSISLGALVGFHRALASLGGRVCIVGASGAVAEVLTRTGLNRLFAAP